MDMKGMSIIFFMVITAALVLMSGCSPLATNETADPNLVANYKFDEGTGDILHDYSGNNANGKITGGKWVKNGCKWALEFNGRDTTVNMGNPKSLDLQENTTITCWLYAEPIYSVFMKLPIVSNNRHIVYQRPHSLQVDTAGWGYGYGLLPSNKWNHFAFTWDGKYTKLYINGILVSHTIGQTDKFPETENFVLAGARKDIWEGGPPEQNDARFKGKMASLKIYKKVMSYEEILADMRSTNITGSVELKPILRPELGVIRIEADAARLGVPLDDVTVKIELAEAGSKNASIKTISVSQFDGRGIAEADVEVPQPGKGKYVLMAIAKNSNGRTIGKQGTTKFDWAGAARFPVEDKGAKRLNNLVTELVNVSGPESGTTATFVNPRKGFIFISNKGSDKAALTPENGETETLILSNDYGNAFETMRYLPKGKYTITTPQAKEFIVRSVCLTVFDYAFTEPHVPEYGVYAGPFEEKYVFPHTNTFLVHDFNIDKPEYAPIVKKWRALGRRMLGNGKAHVTLKEGQTEHAAIVEILTTSKEFTHPDFDGLFLDEFSHSSPTCGEWARGIDAVLSDSKNAARSMLIYDYALFDFLVPWYPPEGRTTSTGYGPEGKEMMDVLRKHDCSILWETYVDNQPSETLAWQALQEKLVGEMAATNAIYSDFSKNTVVDFYSFVDGGPKWRTDTIADVDVRVYMDMQMQLVATHPMYKDVHGIAIYRSAYGSEEMVRLAARLFRHYAIEGNTERFFHDLYKLSHIKNPDFESGLDGWTINAAEPGSIRWGASRPFHSAQCRYGSSASQGMYGIITKRSDKKPNTFSQEIKNLVPGQYYSFRMFSGDINNMENSEKHAITIDFDNVELVPDKCFTHIGGGNGTKYKVNWHARVFRAKGTTATFAVSDWTGDKPDGAIGQELMYNFVKVQPYWPEDAN